MVKAPAKKSEKRKLAKPTYKTLRLHKRIKHSGDKLPSAFAIFKQSLKHIFKYWRLFLGITVVYLILTWILVKGLGAGTNIGDLKTSFQEAFGTGFGQLTSSLALFGVLLGDNTNVSSDVAGAYQSILLVLTSLAVIWALRQTHASKQATTKEAYYKGMYPLIPFVLVLLVIGLQCIPLLIGNFMYSVVIGNGLAVSAAEKMIWALLFFFLALLTLYMISSSLFAMYIVTLPNRTPLNSLRTAREIVRYRRWTILRKVVFLPIVLLALAVIVMIPLILWLTPIAGWVFFFLSMAGLVVGHSYLYSLYRELL